MGKRVFTEEHIEFLRAHYASLSNNDLTALFNQHFNMSQSRKSIEKIKVIHGLKSEKRHGAAKNRILKNSYTAEEIAYLREYAKDCSNEELTHKFNLRFGSNRSVSAIAKCKFKNQIFSGIVHIPTYSQGKPIGSISYKEGKKLIKIAEKKWVFLHKYIWEQANGSIPKGCAVIFGDGNYNNCDISNLILVSRQELITMNCLDLIKDDVDLTKTGVLIADLVNKIGKRAL